VSSDRKKAKPSQSPLEAKICLWGVAKKDKCPEGRIMHFTNIPIMFPDGCIAHNWFFDYNVIAVGILGLSLFCVPFRGKHS
jgi:hypothetical protein